MAKRRNSDEDDSDAELARRKYLYRKLVMNRGVKIPARLAMKMVGPDCAFHLYSQHMPSANDEPSDLEDQ
ncbi:MAG: hypothetical protein AB8B55_16690 [Mariniblastus sp.]